MFVSSRLWKQCACLRRFVFINERCSFEGSVDAVECGLRFVLSASSSAACKCAVVRLKAAVVGAGLVPRCFVQDHSAGCVTQQPELSALGGAVGPYKSAHTQSLTQQTQRAAHTPILSGDHLHQVQYKTKQS